MNKLREQYNHIQLLLVNINQSSTTNKTPQKIVKRMLNKLPQKIWSNPTKTFCDPVCGCGTFLLEIFVRRMDALQEAIPNENERAAQIIRTLYGFDNNLIQLEASISLLLRLTSQYGITREMLNLYNVDSLLYNFRMKFDVVVGNPPYSGIKYESLPRFLKSRKELKKCQSAYPFLLLTIESLLKDDGILTFIIPSEFLCSPQASLLRETIFLLGKITSFEIHENVFKTADVGTCVSFIYQKTSNIQGVFLYGNKIPNFSSNLEIQIFTKIIAKAKQFNPVKFWRGGFSLKGKKQKYVSKYVKGKNEVIIECGPCTANPKTLKAIETATDDSKFICYCEFNNVNNAFKSHKGIINPMPVIDTMIIVPTNTPKKHIALLESRVARFLFMKLFSTNHMGTSLQDLLPDITNELPENPNEIDVFNSFSLNDDEIQYLKKLIHAN